MTTASCKAKARQLQNLVAKVLLDIGKDHGLEAGDIKPVPMGQSGVDILLSPAAKKVFDLSVECKKVEKLSVVSTFWSHYSKYDKDSSLKLLIHSRNRSTPLVTMRIEDFLSMLKAVSQ